MGWWVSGLVGDCVLVLLRLVSAVKSPEIPKVTQMLDRDTARRI